MTESLTASVWIARFSFLDLWLIEAVWFGIWVCEDYCEFRDGSEGLSAAGAGDGLAVVQGSRALGS